MSHGVCVTASAPAVGSTFLKASLSLSVDTPLEGQPGHRLHPAILREVLQPGHHARQQPTLLGEFLQSFLMAAPMLSNCLPGFSTFWSYFSVFTWEEVSAGPRQVLFPLDFPSFTVRVIA